MTKEPNKIKTILTAEQIAATPYRTGGFPAALHAEPFDGAVAVSVFLSMASKMIGGPMVGHSQFAGYLTEEEFRAIHW